MTGVCAWERTNTFAYSAFRCVQSSLFAGSHPTYSIFFAIHRNLLGLNAAYRYVVFQDSTFSYLEKMSEDVVLD